MLSEPRRKRQRITDDPNNLRWAKDNEKIGQKLLEKMGWRAGTGLGVNEQGRTDPLALRANAGFRGFGSDSKTDFDVHSEHRRNFDTLLSSLKEAGGAESPKQSEGEASGSTCSLTSLSKSSRRRIHYSRFAKGKELSTASAIDLATVTGDLEKRTSTLTSRSPDEAFDTASDLQESTEGGKAAKSDVVEKRSGKKFVRQSFIRSSVVLK